MFCKVIICCFLKDYRILFAYFVVGVKPTLYPYHFSMIFLEYKIYCIHRSVLTSSRNADLHFFAIFG